MPRHLPLLATLLLTAQTSPQGCEGDEASTTSSVVASAQAPEITSEEPRREMPIEGEEPPRTPQLTVDAAGNPIPMVLEKIDTAVTIRGLLAETTMTMTFRNTTDRVLEAELVFPLPEEATVSGFALDIDGVMAEAVVVEKEQARIAFEKEVRKGVDPGLVEWVRGNIFRTRVYPMPASGVRTILVRYVHELHGDAAHATYRLPLDFPDAVPEFGLEVQVVRGHAPPTISGLSNLAFTSTEDRWVASASVQDATLDETLIVDLPQLPAQLVSIEQDGDGHTFVIHDHVTPSPSSARLAPKRALLYWDASYSRAEHIERDLAFLDHALARWGGLKLDVVPFRDVPDTLRSFDLSAGQTDALKAFLRDMPYDGGTNLTDLAFPERGAGGAYDIHLLVSDGLGNVGLGTQPSADVPLFTLASSPTSDHALLQYLAHQSGGAHVPLSRLSDEEAAVLFQPQPYAFLGIEQSAEAVEEVFPLPRTPVSGRVHVSGRLLRPDAEITLLYGRDKVERRVPVRLSTSDATQTGLAPRFWAQQVVHAMAVVPDADEDRMLALGRRYGIVTPGTSLLVLENLEQHIEHDVEPPASRPELLSAWRAHERRAQQSEAQRAADKLDTVASWWADRRSWWETDFPVGPPPQDEKVAETMATEEEVADMAVARPAPRARMMSAAPEPEAEEMAMAPEMKKADEGASPRGSITLQPWDPKTPYMAAIKATKTPEDAYQAYLVQRPGYKGQPGYFLDVATYFYAQEQPALARRVLTSILELELDDPALLRVVAYRLAEAGELDLAIQLLEQVLDLRGEEPQSYRDLSDVLAQRGLLDDAEPEARARDLTRALALLRDVILRDWDRFPEIEVIALMEHNALDATVQRLPKAIHSRVQQPPLDKRLQGNLDLDVRISLVWDADLTDIDLWVIEPTEEKAYYSNPRTYLGGLVSRDFTQGYGPEEYVLRKAPEGNFTIQANYYGSQAQTLTGPATVKAVVYTDWGRPEQARQELTLRLDTVKAVVDIGDVSFVE